MPGKRLVVDSCVARSAGDNSQVPDSGHSRRALFAIQQNMQHFLVFNSALKNEWTRHASKFSIGLFTLLVQKKRVVFVSDDAYASVIRACAHQLEDENAKTAFTKDGHVVTAALAADHIIISNEVRLLAQLKSLVHTEKRLAALHWANPVVEGEACARWIADGAETTILSSILPKEE